MDRYSFEIYRRLNGILKQRLSLLDIIETLSRSGMHNIILETAEFVGLKGAELNIDLGRDIEEERVNIVVDQIMLKLSQALGADFRCFSGTLLVKGSAMADEEIAKESVRFFQEYGFAVNLEPRLRLV